MFSPAAALTHGLVSLVLAAAPVAAHASESPAASTGPVVAASLACPASAAAHVVEAVPADVPGVAGAASHGGLAVVEIRLGSDGNLTDARIMHSTGFTPLDLAAVRSARLSRYAAEVRACGAVGGTYTFDVDFN